MARPKGLEPSTIVDGLGNPVEFLLSAENCIHADQIAKRVGVTVELSNQVSAAGEYQNGVIRINTQSEQPVQQIFVHELTHHLEQSGGYAIWWTLSSRVCAGMEWILQN